MFVYCLDSYVNKITHAIINTKFRIMVADPNDAGREGKGKRRGS